MSDLNDVAAALAQVTSIDHSPQADALVEAVAQHLSTRPAAPKGTLDPAVLERLRKED